MPDTQPPQRSTSAPAARRGPLRRGWTRSPLRRVLRIGLVTVLTLGVIVGLLYALQRSLIYFPDGRAVPPATDVLPGASDLVLSTADGLELGAWWVPPAPEAADRKLAVLMAPGNGGNRADRAGLAADLRGHGFTVLVLDYRGFGGNPGRPTEEGLHADVLAASAALQERGFPPERTIYFGESLGTGVVAGLLAVRPPAGVVLRSPFTELADVGRAHYPVLPVGRLLRDRFVVLDHVAATDVPVTVIRGGQDTIVPTELSARVAAAAPNLVEELVLERAGHNDPEMFGPPVADAVARLADTLP